MTRFDPENELLTLDSNSGVLIYCIPIVLARNIKSCFLKPQILFFIPRIQGTPPGTPFFDVSDLVFCALLNEHAYNTVTWIAQKVVGKGLKKSTKL